MLDRHNFKLYRSVGIQTGVDKQDLYYYLPNNKSLRLYHSKAYKAKVASLNISTTKSFIFDKETWLEFRQLVDHVNYFFENEN